MAAEFEKIGLPFLVLVLLLLFVFLHAMSVETTDKNFLRDHIGYTAFSLLFFGILILRTHVSGGRIDILDVIIKTMAFIVLMWILLWVSGARKWEDEDYIDESAHLNAKNNPSYTAGPEVSPVVPSRAHHYHHLPPNSHNQNSELALNPHNITEINQNEYNRNSHVIRSSTTIGSHVPLFQLHHQVLSRNELFSSASSSSEIISRAQLPPAYSSLETLNSEPPPPYEECCIPKK